MPAHREHIAAPHPLHLIAPLSQILHIPGQGGGIAADIDHPLR